MAKKRDIDYIIEQIVTLPSMPGAIAKARSMLDDPKCSMSEVGQYLSLDPAISLKVLRLINSAYYALPEKVTSVEHAVSLLGAKVVKNLVLTATLLNTFSGAEESFYRHSLATGLAMEILAGTGPFLDSDEAFVFGVIHDIGKLIFEEYMPDEFAAVLDCCQRDRIPAFRAEGLIIGADHAALGARLAAHWGLPEELVQAVESHHELFRCGRPAFRPIAAMLSTADYLCHASGLHAFGPQRIELEAAVWPEAGITSEMVPDVMDRFYGALPKVEELVALARA